MAEEGAAASRVSVMGPRFCVPNSVDLSISERVWQLTGRGDFVVKDSNGDVVFKVETPSFRRSTRVMTDAAAGVPIATLKSKSYSGRSRWRVFRGESREEREMIFSVRRSSRFRTHKLEVFLPNNKSEDVPDYTLVKKGLIHRSCQVYVGDSSTVIAQMQENSSIGCKFSGKDKFRVTVHPNIDYAFIVALIIIKEEIDTENSTLTQ